MFERFSRKKKHAAERKEPEPLVSGFVEDHAMEELARKFNALARDVIGYKRDGTPEELAAAEARLDEASAGDTGQKLREYLRPYIERGGLPRDSRGVSQSEYDRWYAAVVLQFDND